MEQETGVLLQTEEMCTKTGERVMEVMHTKHMDTLTSSTATLDTYPDRPLDIVPMDIT